MIKSKVMIVDDHRVVIEGIKGILSNMPEFEVIGEALNGRQLMKRIESVLPDIVIMDISMPYLNGFDTTMQIKQKFRDISIIIYTMHSENEFIISFFNAGVSAYVLKCNPLSELILALKSVRQKGMYFSSSAKDFIQKHLDVLEKNKKGQNAFDSLSLREREVLQLLAEGKSIKEIAAELCVSPKTAETHKYNIMAKLNTKRLANLIKIAIKKKLVAL